MKWEVTMDVEALRELVDLHMRYLLRSCRTREACMDLSADLQRLARMIGRVADEDCHDRANDVDRAQQP